MKFRDGMWLTAEGMWVEYAEEVYNITETEKGLSLLCPTRKIMSRGDTLNRSTVTIDIEAVADGIISYELTHWAGAVNRGPHFELFPDGPPPAFEHGIGRDAAGAGGGTTLRAGPLSATVSGSEHTFDIRFHSENSLGGGSSSSSSAGGAETGTTGAGTPTTTRTLTSLGTRSVGFAYSPAPTSPMQTEDMRGTKHYMFAQTALGVGESVHGLGERFGAFNKVGQSIALWNADGGTSSEQAYKNVSLFLSSRGYGVFVDHAGRVELEVGSERCSRAQASVEGQRLRCFVLDGPSPRDVLRRWALLTGRPARVPAWSYGLWLSTSFTTSYDEDTVTNFLEGMRERDIPVDVFHYDCFWMKAFTWTDFVFDAERFPDPAAQIARLKASGLVRKVCAWINPYIAQHGAAFRHAADRGYLLRRRSSGDVWQWDLWQAGMGLVDLTNPAAAAWYADCLGRLLDAGVDCLKTDFGERIPTRDVAWHDAALDPDKMHNFYALLFNRTVYAVLEARHKGQPGEGPVLFARSATAGTQRFPLVWGGDCESTPEAMAESVRGGLGLGLCGYAFWSNDIGGFEGSPPPWVYKRWVAFGLLCSHSRLHGSNSYRVPWTVDGDDRGPEGCSRVLARWTALKSRLMPYLIAQGAAAADAGLPLSLRAMCIEFPEDPTAWYLDRQFMLGPSLLVAPIFEESGEVQFYLPRGRWTSFFTNATRDGPGWFRERHSSFGSLPLYVRQDTVLVLGPPSARGAVYDYFGGGAEGDKVEVCVYQGVQKSEKGPSAPLVDAEGRDAGMLEVVVDGDGEFYRELRGTEALREGGWVQSDNRRRIDEEEKKYYRRMIEWL
ncbi:family 31 glycoside hydrolase [Xylariaceae sp. FL0804]|nr:family 31 glycoside hydrolase [Xylariaceae sp. FL0804]